MVRLGGDQRSLLVREREHEGGGAHFVFDFEGISSSSPSSSALSSLSFNRGSASIPSSPFYICTTPLLLQCGPPSALSNYPFTYLYRTSHSPSSITPPCTIPYRCMHTGTPTPARRTDAALSVSARSRGAVRGRCRADGGGCWFVGGKRMREIRRARARTDEDTSSVRAWRLASCFSQRS